MMLTIRIKNLHLRTYIGFNEEEQNKKQDVLINIRFDYPAETAMRRDQVDAVVNYRTLTKQIIQLVEEGRFLLLEKLTADILDLVMSYEAIQYAEVEVDKPHALRFSESVSARLQAHRADYD